MSALRKGARGDAVRALQVLVLSCGGSLPRWGTDGALGDETLSAVDLLLKGLAGTGIAADDVVTGEEIAALQALADARTKRPTADPRIIDRRREADDSNRIRRRPWGEITGITLHQTAVVLGERPSRWDTLRAHVGVTLSGQVLLVHDPSWLVYHGNDFNRDCIGIEIDGHFAGVKGDLNTYWRPDYDPDRQPLQLGAAQVEGARAALRWAVERVAQEGGRVRCLYAHRQASGTRRSDPGEEIWRALAPWARDVLGLETPLEHTRNSARSGRGRPIPRAWDDTAPDGADY